MNRTVARNVGGLHPGQQPPRRRERRTRMLFVTLDAMGWSTYGSAVAGVTAERDDIDAVHLRYWGGGLMRALSAPVPHGTGWLDSEARRVAVARWRLGRWARRRLQLDRYDVVHVTPHSYAAGFLPLVGGAGPRLSVALDATIWQEKGELQGLTEAEVRRRWAPLVEVQQSVTTSADLVVAMSRWAAEGVVRRFAVDRTRVTVVPPGVAPVAHRPGATTAARRLHEAAPRGLVRVVFVGNDWRRKGGDRLLRWHQQRWSELVELHVCSAGAPQDRRARNVVWHGAVPNDELRASLLPGMDLMVLPTRHDMSPWALAEGHMAGLPAVASAIGGIGEIVRDGVTGLLVAAHDDAAHVRAVELLLSDVALRRRMAAAATVHGHTSLAADVVGNRLVDELAALASVR